MDKVKKDQFWVEAKRRCHLSNEAVNMAKEMGLNPKSLIKNIASSAQQWKAPWKNGFMICIISGRKSSPDS